MKMSHARGLLFSAHANPALCAETAAAIRISIHLFGVARSKVGPAGEDHADFRLLPQALDDLIPDYDDQQARLKKRDDDFRNALVGHSQQMNDLADSLTTAQDDAIRFEEALNKAAAEILGLEEQVSKLKDTSTRVEGLQAANRHLNKENERLWTLIERLSERPAAFAVGGTA